MFEAGIPLDSQSSALRDAGELAFAVLRGRDPKN